MMPAIILSRKDIPDVNRGACAQCLSVISTSGQMVFRVMAGWLKIPYV
jgi:hypothetical protein